MNLGLQNKKVLVVGASKGIGHATALAFAAEDAIVTVVARSESLLEGLLADMKGGADKHSMVVADLQTPGAPAKLAQSLLADHGPFDVVTHCVGGPLGIREPLSPLEDWHNVWQFNCGIAIEMNEFLVKPMVEAGWGRVIHISSISGIMLRGAPAYACAKAYLNAYTKTVGRALASKGVVVSAVLPGAVSFPGSYWDEFVKEGHPRVHDFLSHHQAADRMGTPDEIASFVLMMASEQASFAHAALIPVDGGNM